MKYSVQFMHLALQDYDDIQEYLSGFYPSTAAKFLDELEKSVAVLEDNPRAFAKYEHNVAYRRMVVMDYLVFYKVKEKHKTVEIHRILHGARNIKRFLEIADIMQAREEFAKGETISIDDIDWN